VLCGVMYPFLLVQVRLVSLRTQVAGKQTVLCEAYAALKLMPS